MQLEGFFTACDFRHTLHHDPVLGTMVMILQRQLSARFHGDAFDLVALAPVDTFKGSPTGGQPFGDRSIRCAEPFSQVIYNRFDLFHVVSAGHQQRIGRVHHDNVPSGPSTTASFLGL